MRNKLKFVLIALLLSAVFYNFSFSQNITAANSPLISKDVYFAKADDIVIRGVFKDYDYWFSIPRFIDLEQATLIINLSHAKELIADLATLTISLNGTPIKSIFLTPLNSDNHRISIDLPQESIFAGFNNIKFSFFMRSTTVPCADVDNPVNWSVIHNDSLLRFKFRVAGIVPLSSFEQAFSAAGVLFPSDIAFVLDDGLDTGSLQAASIISNFLGSTSTDAKSIKVFYKSDVSADILSKYNIIVLGEPAKLPLLDSLSKAASLNTLTESLNSIKEDEALVFLIPSLWAPDRFVFGISANGPDIKRAALYVAQSKLEEATGNIAVLKDLPLADDEISAARRLSSKITFEDLGYTDRVVRGIFSRSTSFKFSRPYNWKLKPNSKLNLITSFSSFLKPHTSALNVDINGIPAGSSRFFGNPEKPLLVSVNIPRENLDDRELFISANFYLDIGQQDCDHLQGEKAWAVIKKDSNFFLPHSFKKDKDFSDFPSMLMNADELMPTSIVVADKPSQDTLSLALTISAAIGSALQQELTFPKIIKSSLMDVGDKGDNIMLIGQPDDFGGYDELKGYLPLDFDEQTGLFDIKEIITEEELPTSYAVMQMCASPWSRHRTVSMLSAEDKGYALLKGIFTDITIQRSIKGNLIYADALDNVLSFDLKPRLEAQFIDSTLEMRLLALSALIVVLLVLLLVYMRMRRKKS